MECWKFVFMLSVISALPLSGVLFSDLGFPQSSKILRIILENNQNFCLLNKKEKIPSTDKYYYLLSVYICIL